MNSRERVIAALDHREPDRVPIDLGGTIVSSIHRQAYVDLKQYLGMPVEDLTLVDYVQQLPYLDEKLLERFDVDFRMVQLPAANGLIFPIICRWMKWKKEVFWKQSTPAAAIKAKLPAAWALRARLSGKNWLNMKKLVNLKQKFMYIHT